MGVRWAPPQKPHHYGQMARAGFNVIVDYVGPDALDLARDHGLKLMVAKIGLDARTLSTREGRKRASGHIERFSDHPALWGYFLGDQPRERDFGDLARAAAFARAHDPEHPCFISLLPCDTWVGPRLATADYAGYVERFVRAVRPALLNYGQFPFRVLAESRFYFENLELIRRVALAHGLPFSQTIRGSIWRGMRPIGEGEMRWLVYTSLAYGAKGIVWFSYWGAPGGSGEGIMGPDGVPTERYRQIARLNAELRALGPTLVRLRSAAVYHTGDVPVGATRLPVHGLVGGVEGGSFVVGLFEDDGSERYALVVNKDYRREEKS